MTQFLIQQATIVNEGRVFVGDLRINGQRIERIDTKIEANPQDTVIDAKGKFLMPGMIDDQVHFREPGLTHKATIASESKAAVAGGITSFMEMPNVNPATTNRAALDHKYELAQASSAANFAFYLGATEDNLEEIKQLDPAIHCGVKVFMGASTGDLLVEKPEALEAIFQHSPVPIITHCESGPVIAKNAAKFSDNNLTPSITDHPIIRDAAACYASSSYAVQLAKRFGTQLHVLHISTAKELELFEPGPMAGKSITAEACVHHLWFCDQDYPQLGNLIKCNPAIKSASDLEGIWHGVRDGRIDIIATDHAPHTWDEKQQAYPQAPAGLPLVEHALLSLFDQVRNGRLDHQQLVEKVCHNPTVRFGIHERGFLREGYFADLVLVDPNKATPARHCNTRYKCAWTPFDGHDFSASIDSTWVNGHQVYDGQSLSDELHGQPLVFNR